MLELEGINYLAVALTWLIYVTIGSFWYSPAGFGKAWAKLSGVNHLKMPEKEATRTIGLVSVSAVIQALTLAVLINSLNATTIIDGLTVGVVVWLGLTAATTIGNNFYMRLGWKFWWLNASYFLLTMSIGSVLLAVWR